MAHHSPTDQVWADDVHKRPKGILKNSDSYRTEHTSPAAAAPVTTPPAASSERPDLNRELSEKEIVMQNTLQNAGGHRRSSSNPRGSTSRRQSSTQAAADENSPRLKWDEANLYLTEQQRDSTMKITEPKTPYAKQYDPAEDEEEMAALDADSIKVDEVDMKKPAKKPTREDIPDLDLGEPEMDAPQASHTPDSEKRVIVDDTVPDDEGRHGEEFADMTAEEREKHRKFEQMRKKHYEMKNVKNLLGHPEDLPDEDEDEERHPVPSTSDEMDINGS
ncbi:hypothetical protein K402DRAFT_389354 [Aulographum hederae CBS 113979]|uniref:Glc8 protein n=1 Tax=Aulographum hederae CBS 113979 TaxID=1176131 RepID=A0A6G1HDL5_9PEZI|nr:hypothetical protein K402DRAFT_389354 [Aulographum hederae CBS 113979]